MLYKHTFLKVETLRRQFEYEDFGNAGLPIGPYLVIDQTNTWIAAGNTPKDIGERYVQDRLDKENFKISSTTAFPLCNYETKTGIILVRGGTPDELDPLRIIPLNDCEISNFEKVILRHFDSTYRRIENEQKSKT